jgi:phage/plasmid-like protein (TIGR03299 family)
MPRIATADQGINATAINIMNGGNKQYASIYALGTKIDADNMKDAVKQSKIDWTVSKVQHVSPFDGNPVPSWGVYRDDSKQFLGQVGSDWTAVQTLDQFSFVDDLIQHIPGARYTAAGTTENNQKVFVCANIGDFEVGAEGDKHTAYLVVSDWKNSRGSCRAQLSVIREICGNGMSVMIDNKVMTFKHTKYVKERMDSVSQSVNNITDAYLSLKSKLDTIATRTITSKDTVIAIFDKLFPETEAEKNGRANNRRAETQAFVADLLAKNDDNAFPSEAKTPLAVFNSYTNFIDHYMPMKQSRTGIKEELRRADSALFGNGAELKNRALEIILEETRDLPSITKGASLLDAVLTNASRN